MAGDKEAVSPWHMHTHARTHINTYTRGPNSLFLTQTRGCFSVSVGSFWLVLGRKSIAAWESSPKAFSVVSQSVYVCVRVRVCMCVCVFLPSHVEHMSEHYFFPLIYTDSQFFKLAFSAVIDPVLAWLMFYKGFSSQLVPELHFEFCAGSDPFTFTVIPLEKPGTLHMLPIFIMYSTLEKYS